MAVHKLVIVVDDSDANEDTDPLSSALSNLEYDGYEVIQSSIEIDDRR